MRAIVIGRAVNLIGTIGAGDGTGRASESANKPQEITLGGLSSLPELRKSIRRLADLAGRVNYTRATT